MLNYYTFFHSNNHNLSSVAWYFIHSKNDTVTVRKGNKACRVVCQVTRYQLYSEDVFSLLEVFISFHYMFFFQVAFVTICEKYTGLHIRDS